MVIVIDINYKSVHEQFKGLQYSPESIINFSIHMTKAFS